MKMNVLRPNDTVAQNINNDCNIQKYDKYYRKNCFGYTKHKSLPTLLV